MTGAEIVDDAALVPAPPATKRNPGRRAMALRARASLMLACPHCKQLVGLRQVRVCIAAGQAPAHPKCMYKAAAQGHARALSRPEEAEDG